MVFCTARFSGAIVQVYMLYQALEYLVGTRCAVWFCHGAFRGVCYVEWTYIGGGGSSDLSPDQRGQGKSSTARCEVGCPMLLIELGNVYCRIRPRSQEGSDSAMRRPSGPSGHPSSYGWAPTGPSYDCLSKGYFIPHHSTYDRKKG